MGMNKKITIISILLMIEFAIILFVGIFTQSHSISIKYNDDEILGKTAQEIVNKYGLFDIAISVGENDEIFIGKGYYFIKKSIDVENYYYVISFNEFGVAESINEVWMYPHPSNMPQWTKQGNVDK